MASLGAGAVHAAATGIHAEHPQLARLFVAVAAAQLGAGLWGLLRPGRAVAAVLAAVNAAAVGGWLLTRLTGVSWIDGLEAREAAQFADTACAVMGAVAAGAAIAALLVGTRPSVTPSRTALPAMAVAVLALPAMWTGGTHVHSHADGAAHAHDTTVTGEAVAHEDGTDHPHDTTVTGDTVPHEDHLATWPRPWDPSTGVDFSGVEGVSPTQEDRAERLVVETLDVLPRWATTEAAEADGFRSIGDASTGSEHYIRYDYITDDRFMDPNYPESLVYTVDGDSRTLAGVMFIASARPTDDPTLTD